MQIKIQDDITSRDLDRFQDKVVGDILNFTITGNPRWRFMADAALLSLLVQASEAGSKVFLNLPSAANQTLPRTVERQMTETISGILLGSFSSEVFGPSQRKLKSLVREVQLKRLIEDGGVVASGLQAAAVALDRFGAPRAATLFDTPYPQKSVSEIEKMVRGVTGITAPHFADLRYVIHFLAELVQNTRDHAISDLNGKRIEGARFFTAKRIDLSSLRPDGWYENADEVFASYFRRIQGEHDVKYIMEMNVSDSGMGIAATLSSDSKVYSGPIDAEFEWIKQSFVRSVSSKPRSIPGRGQGLANVLTYVDHLRGLLVVRSGRTMLSFNRLVPNDSPASSESFQMDQRPLLRGTTVTVLVPWRDK